MLNHARTLLINRDGDKTPGADFIGEEAVPTDFRAVTLPEYLRAVRSRLFGADPDRAMLNYRAAQFMAVLHAADELAEFVTDLDTRVTYLTSPRRDLFAASTFEPTITQILGPDTPTYLQGEPAAPDAAGRVFFQYKIDILSATTVAVEQQTKPKKIDIHDFALTDGVSNRVPLGDSGYGILLGGADIQCRWRIEAYNRPRQELGQIVTSLRSVGEPTLLGLFGVAPSEPFKTFRNLWNDHPEMLMQLSGLLLAVVYRTDEIRRGVNNG